MLCIYHLNWNPEVFLQHTEVLLKTIRLTTLLEKLPQRRRKKSPDSWVSTFQSGAGTGIRSISLFWKLFYQEILRPRPRPTGSESTSTLKFEKHCCRRSYRTFFFFPSPSLSFPDVKWKYNKVYTKEKTKLKEHSSHDCRERGVDNFSKIYTCAIFNVVGPTLLLL